MNRFAAFRYFGLLLLPALAVGIAHCGVGLDTLTTDGPTCNLSAGSFGGTAGFVVSGPTGAAGATAASEDDEALTSLMDPQGRIVIAGYSGNSNLPIGYNMTVWRYLPDGSPDPSFGSSGVAFASTNAAGLSGATGTSFNDQAFAILLDSAGRLLVGGYSKKQGGGQLMALVRLTSAGVLDSTFGTNGVVLSSTTGVAGGTGTSEDDECQALAIDSQGHIVVGGFSAVSAGSKYQQVLWRYNSDGSPDTSFGNSGIATWGSTGAAGGTSTNLRDAGYPLKIDSQGRIVVAGYSKNGAGHVEMALWRYNANGTPDASFGTGGAVVWGANGAAGAAPASESDRANSLQIDSQGRLIVTGASLNASAVPEMVIWRYNPDGTPDLTFGSAGVLAHGTTSATGQTGASEYEDGNSLQIDSQGRYIIAGYSANQSGPSQTEAVIWRYGSDGTLDTSFGTAGIVTSGLTGPAGGTGSHLANTVNSLTVDCLGRLTAVGVSQNANGGNEVAIWRY